MKKLKAIHKKIFETVDKNYCYFGNIKKKDITEEYNIHTKYSWDEEAKRVELFICPSKNEIVGGSKDGKTFFYSFAFDIANFLSQLISQKLIVNHVIYASKSKELECDTIIFVMKYRKEEIVLRVLSRPAKEIQKNLIQHTNIKRNK